MTDLGQIPVAGIPIQTWEHGATELFHLAGALFGGGGLTAGQLKAEMDNVQWDDLDLISTRLTAASSYLAGDFQTKLTSILGKLNDAYQGAANDIMASRFQQAQSSATSLAPTFAQLGSRVDDIHRALTECAKAVGGYSRFGSDVSNVTSHLPFGGESEDDKARDAWNKCAGSFESTGSAMPFASGGATTFQNYTPPTPVQTQLPATVPNPGAVGPGPGPGGAVPQGHVTPPLHLKPYPVGSGSDPGPSGPGTPGPGSDGSGNYGSGGYGSGGYGPGSYGSGSHGSGGDGSGGYGSGGYGSGGYGPGDSGSGSGAGLDTGTTLAGYGPGPGPGGAGGGGVGGSAAGLPGGGSANAGLASGAFGNGSGLAGAGGDLGGGAGGAAAGATAAGATAAGAAGRGGVGVGVPMGGRGGGGGSDSDRERSTWLTEDDDVWGASDAPDGVIT